jgi:hypothetical protein
MLYLLSLADTRAVSERAYSAAELRAMRELYERVLIAMTREEEAEVLSSGEAREEMVQRERQRLRREMRNLEFDEETLQHLCDNLPTSYVLNTPLPTIADAPATAGTTATRATHRRLLPRRARPFSEMTVVAYDDPEPGLLSKICGVVYAAGMDIRMAQVFTINDWQSESEAEAAPLTSSEDDHALAVQSSTRSIVLDRLHVSRNGRSLTSAQSARLAALLREVLLGHKTVEETVESAGKSRPAGVTPVKISVRNDLSDEHSVLTLINDNVPGCCSYHAHAGWPQVGHSQRQNHFVGWSRRRRVLHHASHQGTG